MFLGTSIFNGFEKVRDQLGEVKIRDFRAPGGPRGEENPNKRGKTQREAQKTPKKRPRAKNNENSPMLASNKDWVGGMAGLP